jgi:hypothetical protein
LIESNPQSPLLFYNVACCECLSGQSAGALVHVRRAIELSEQFRDYAKSDSDLDPIRDGPSFKELTGS